MTSSKDPILAAFGSRVRQLRKERSLSQEALADEAGLDRSYIGQVERGEKNVSLSNICRISNALNVPPQSLLETIYVHQE
ncbi:helix-turn-helix transcriptional regulator [Rhodobacter capsulatus]|uniref:Helix-turn-helix transcriptional regulator n=1 Tax=Rhodobacter capsulatus TaxID=1061 RepID=A0A4U1K003_RHOCA|nr:helix-turn-helix transcriptional regulator [Rhodobacter capsulatus]TKD25122.1 helix-turn-helix transcriptional regulator [Rhodobacter capsulatus]